MTKYRIEFKLTSYMEYEIEAPNEDEAHDKALDMLMEKLRREDRDCDIEQVLP